MTERSEGFYAALPELQTFVDVVDGSCYRDAPDDWCVVITDVRGSTRAIEQGRYRDVNALGVSSIIAVRNAIPSLDVPFVFGGDGATLLVPERRRAEVECALRAVSELAVSAFDLELRCGIVPIKDLAAQNLRVAVARFRISEHVVLAMLMGEGVTAAESWIKDELRGAQYAVPQEGPKRADLDGFQCRWQPVSSERGSILSILVEARATKPQGRTATYQRMLHLLGAMMGERTGHPIARRYLKLRGPFDDYECEARVQSGQRAGPMYQAARSLARNRALIGRGLIATGMSAGGFDGKRYPEELVRNCDFRKFDETLRMVVDVTAEQIAAIERVLEQARVRGEVFYGLHRSSKALITCDVRSFSGDHVHFVDGSDGGYALASKQLKAQRAEVPTR
jgi:hypothetical protein